MTRAVILLTLVTMLGGCAATISPQPTPQRPTAVYVADYGIHSSLLLPTGNGRYVEYAFGDWGYAALNHCLPQDALGALLVSFQSALGRRYVDVQPGQSDPHPVHPQPVKLQVVYVPQDRVDRVLQELDERYQRGGQPVHNPENDTDYVKDNTEHYWVGNNCNHLTARWLEEMGCGVHGLVVLSKFEVVPPQKASGPELARNKITAPTMLSNSGSD